MSSSAKTGSAAGSKSYNFYGSIAGGFSAGPLYQLDAIEIDNEEVWSGAMLQSESANPVSISIPGRGIIRLYWGLEDQIVNDPILRAGGNNLFHEHPAYTGDCYCVLVDFLFGQERTTAPTIRIRGRRKPVQSLITGSATNMVDAQANPFVVLAELLTSERYGRGLPLSLFNASAWQAAADALITRASKTYVSLFLDSQQNARAVGVDLLRLCDGWLRAELGTGRAEVGLFPPPEDIVVGSLPLVDSSALESPPEFTPQTEDDTYTRTVVTFLDRTNNFKERSVKYDDPIATDRRRIQTINAGNYLVRAAQADDFAVRLGRRSALPTINASALSVRATRSADIRPGQHIRSDIDPEPGGLRLEQVFRVHAVTRSPIGATKLVVESEPTLAPVLYDPGTEPTPPELVEVPDIVTAMIFELPPPLALGEEFRVGFLISRPSELITECAIHYDSINDSSATYPPIGSHRAFALRGEVEADYADTDSGAIRVRILYPVSLEIIEENPGITAARNDELLMLIFSTPIGTVFGDPPYQMPLEVFSVAEFIAVEADVVDVVALRARAGTPARAHVVDEQVWFIRRSNLPYYYHKDFKDQASLDIFNYFKLQPGTFQASRPLEDCSPWIFRFDTVRAYAPVITLTSPENDSGEDFVSCTTGATLTFEGTVFDQDGNLVRLTINRSSSLSPDTALFNHAFVPTKNFSFSDAITFADAGVYQVTLTAADSTNRTTTKVIQVRVGTYSTGACQPVINNPYEDDRRVWEPDPAEGYRGSIVTVNVFRSPSMALIGGSSSTVRIRWLRVPAGAPCPSDLDTFSFGSDNTATEVDSNDETFEWSHEERRTWAYAEDSAGLLTRSAPLSFGP